MAIHDARRQWFGVHMLTENSGYHWGNYVDTITNELELPRPVALTKWLFLKSRAVRVYERAST